MIDSYSACVDVERFRAVRRWRIAEAARARESDFLRINRPGRVHWFDNGAVCKFKLPSRGLPPRGSTRGRICGFSAAARRRLLEFMASIDRAATLPAQMWMLTLTYPGVWSGDPIIWKKHLDNFLLRLRRAWGDLGLVWKLEFQRRGAPHFHIILQMPLDAIAGMQKIKEFYDAKRNRNVRIWTGGDIGKMREWCSKAWYECVGSGDSDHLMAGTQVEPIESWEQCQSYAGKYLGKEVELLASDFALKVPEANQSKNVSLGKFWGVRNKEQFKVTERQATCEWMEWIKIQRPLRKFVAKQGKQHKHLKWKLRSTTAFVPASIIERLLTEHLPSWRFSLTSGCLHTDEGYRLLRDDAYRRREDFKGGIDQAWLDVVSDIEIIYRGGMDISSVQTLQN